jgi:hypothetical protein
LSSRKLLVYVQALPISFPVSPKNFADLNASDFALSHSSKAALAFASTMGFPEILASGFSPVLPEALARGATDIAPIPLCDDPKEQATFLPKGDFSHVIIGENPDWVFSGASFAGVLSQSRNIPVNIIRDEDGEPVRNTLSANSLLLILDSGELSSFIDVRRIKYSTSEKVQPENVLGYSVFNEMEEKRSEKITGTPSEISAILSKKLRRLGGRKY